VACCHPGVGGPIGRHDSHFPSGPNNGSAIASTIEAASAPGLCISEHPDCSFRKRSQCWASHHAARAPIGLFTDVRWGGGRHDVRSALVITCDVQCLRVPPRE